MFSSPYRIKDCGYGWRWHLAILDLTISEEEGGRGEEKGASGVLSMHRRGGLLSMPGQAENQTRGDYCSNLGEPYYGNLPPASDPTRIKR